MIHKIRKFLLTNQNAKQTVAKNTFWLFAGEIIGRILKLAVVVFATRVLGVEGWGTFSYALAFVSLFYVFGDVGINSFITIEMAKGGENKYQYLSATLVIKVILLMLSFIVSVILVSHFKTIALDVKIIAILALLHFSDSIREFALSVNRALEKMEREAFIRILTNGAITILGIALLMKKASPLSLAIAYASGSIVATIVILWMLVPELKHVNWKFSKKMLRVIFNFSWPFVAISLFSAAIASIDSIMLGQMKSAIEVGFYAAAQRLVQFLTIIPAFIGIATFPIMSKNESDASALTSIFEKTMTAILAIGIPIALGGFLLRKEIITLIFGSAYAPGGIVFGILVFSIFALFPNIILSNVIFVKHLQKKFVIATIAGVAVNIIFNIFLIPRYGAVGAAVSTVVTQLLILIINWRMLKRFFSFEIASRLKKIMLAVMIMILVMTICNTIGIYFIFTILIAIASYLLSLHLLREPVLIEIISIVS